MKLVIVESPAKSKTISKYLGSEYKVLASIGHVRDLPKSNKKAIAWHLSEIITEGKKEKRKDIKRVTYHEITKEAVEEAFKHPRDIDENLKEAQEARRVLDRLVGYDLSGLIWKKVRYGLSAGRVQSPALRIIME